MVETGQGVGGGRPARCELRVCRRQRRGLSLQAVALALERIALGVGHRGAVAELDPPAVPGHAVHPELVVEVRPAREAGRPDVADGLALRHARAPADPAGESAQVFGDPAGAALFEVVGGAVAAVGGTGDEAPCGRVAGRALRHPGQVVGPLPHGRRGLLGLRLPGRGVLLPAGPGLTAGRPRLPGLLGLRWFCDFET